MLGLSSDLDPELESQTRPRQMPIGSEEEAENDPEAAADHADEGSTRASTPSTNTREDADADMAISWRKIRADIYSEITIVKRNNQDYLQCKHCPQQYKRSGGTRNA